MRKIRPKYIAIASALGFTILAVSLIRAMNVIANIDLDDLEL